MRYAEKHLAERRDARIAVVGNSRSEKISGKGAVNSSAKDIVAVIASEIGDRTEPMVCVIGNRCTAAVQVEAINTGGRRIFSNIRISGEHIEFRRVLRERSGTKKGD